MSEGTWKNVDPAALGGENYEDPAGASDGLTSFSSLLAQHLLDL